MDPPERDISYFDPSSNASPCASGHPARPAALAGRYFVRYTAPDGDRGSRSATRRTMTLDEARVSARATLGIVDKAVTPAERTALRQAWTSARRSRPTAPARVPAQERQGPDDDQRLLTNHIVHRLGRERCRPRLPAVRRLMRSIEGDKRTNRKRSSAARIARKAVRCSPAR